MNEQSLTLSMAILELIDLYHSDRIEYYKVVVTICAFFNSDPARPLSDKQHQRLEEVRETVIDRTPHPFRRKEEGQHVTAKSPSSR